MNRVDYFCDKLDFLTIGDVPGLLKILGNYHTDKITITGHTMRYRIILNDLRYHFPTTVKAKHSRLIHFWGGPNGLTEYSGRLLHVAVDRAMLASCEHGIHLVLGVIEGFKQGSAYASANS